MVVGCKVELEKVFEKLVVAYSIENQLKFVFCIGVKIVGYRVL